MEKTKIDGKLKEEIKNLQKENIKLTAENYELRRKVKAQDEEIAKLQPKISVGIEDDICGMPYTEYIELLNVGYKVVRSAFVDGRYIRILEKY